MKKFDLLVDFDTALVSAAAAQQENYILAKYSLTGKTKEFENRTAFKAWLKDNPKWTADHFEIVDQHRIVGSVKRAVDGLLGRMNDICESNPVKSAKFVVGGVHGNFRDKIARIQPYKGKRGSKPFLFNDIKAKLIFDIGKYILQPQGAYESDDLISMYLAEDLPKGLNSTRAISSPDKDLKMCVGYHTDANKWDAPATYTDDFDGFYQYVWQGLRGDAIDNIQGIPTAVESVREKFGIRKGKGFGEVSATKCLEGITSKEGLAERLAWVYKETFKDGLVIPSGETLTWVEVMDENMQLLKMLDYEGQDYKFSKEWNIDN
jgi:hypothetical protein